MWFRRDTWNNIHSSFLNRVLATELGRIEVSQSVSHFAVAITFCLRQFPDETALEWSWDDRGLQAALLVVFLRSSTRRRARHAAISQLEGPETPFHPTDKSA